MGSKRAGAKLGPLVHLREASRRKSLLLVGSAGVVKLDIDPKLIGDGSKGKLKLLSRKRKLGEFFVEGIDDLQEITDRAL